MQHKLRAALRTLPILIAATSGCASADGGEGVAARLREPPPGAAGAFLAGRFGTSDGDLDAATDQLLQAFAIAPDDEMVRQQTFVTTLLAGRPEAAKLAAGQPDNLAAQLLMFDGDTRARHWGEAQARVAALPRQGVTALLIPLLTAWAQQGAGDTTRALSTLRPFVEGERYRGVYALHAAMIADLGGRTADATRLYGLSQQSFPTLNLALGRILASWQARSGDPAAARKTLDATLAQNPDFQIAGPALLSAASRPAVADAGQGVAEAYLALAAALRTQDAADFALVLCRLALDMNPDMTTARLLAAEQSDIARHPQAALAVLAPVRADDPLITLVELRRASLLDRMGQTEPALAALHAMAERLPDRPEPWLVQAGILRVKKRWAEAVTAYDAALSRIGTPGPDDWGLFYERGIAQERAGHWERAEVDLLRALELSPDQPSVLNYLGYSWTEQARNLPRARKMVERAAEQRPNDGAIIDSLGWIALREGDKVNALKWLEKAAELQPGDATINYHLGEVYDAVGRSREAGFQWRRAATLDPEPDDAEKIARRLQALGATPPTRASSATP